MYYTGEGAPKNYKKAFEWFKKSSEQGHAKVQYNLGTMYYNGKGTAKNYQKAYTHFLIYDYLEHNQDTVKELINKLEQKLSTKEIKNAQNEAEKMSELPAT